MPYVLHDAPLRVGMTVFVSGDEAYHVVNSRRMRVGDRLALQDPSGGRFAAELIALGRGEATFAIQSPLAVPEPPRVRVTLLQAAVKDKAAERIIQKSTGLGVAAIHFFPSQYGSVAPRALGTAKRQARWERIAWEACEQSGRQFSPTLASAPDPATILREHPAHATRERVAWLLHPLDACTPGVSLAEPVAHGVESVTILVGLEGGFGASEIEAARTGGLHSGAPGRHHPARGAGGPGGLRGGVVWGEPVVESLLKRAKAIRHPRPPDRLPAATGVGTLKHGRCSPRMNGPRAWPSADHTSAPHHGNTSCCSESGSGGALSS